MRLKIIIVLVLGTILAAVYSFLPEDAREAASLSSAQKNPPIEASARDTNQAASASRMQEEKVESPLTSIKAAPSVSQREAGADAPQPGAAQVPEQKDVPSGPAAKASDAEAPAVQPAAGGAAPAEQMAMASSTGTQNAESLSVATQQASKIFSQPDKREIMELQQNLADFGYAVGSVDGVLGPKTYGAILEFQSDLGAADIISIPKLVSLLDTYKKVGAYYPTWKTIFRSDQFKKWIASKSPSVSEDYMKTLRTGPDQGIVNIINEFYLQT